MCESRPTSKKKHTIAQIYKLHFNKYVKSKESRQLRLTDKVFKAVRKTLACRTKKLGLVHFACLGCGLMVTITRGCNGRFCPSCGAGETMKWAQKTIRRILNIKHFHAVFTLPKHMRMLSKMNGNLLHNLLFKISAELIREWFGKKHNILPGMLSVLHTSGADLKYHPHVHMIISGGGKLQNLGESKYKELKTNYLEDNEKLGRSLKKKFEKSLIREYKNGRLKVRKGITDVESFKKSIQKIGLKHWIVNVEKPLSDVHQIVGYVGRYTKRACISEYKLEEIKDQIKFQYNDYKNSKRHEKAKISIKTYDPIDFLDALFQHVPEARYRMVRYYGLYNSKYLNRIPKCWKLAEEETGPIVIKVDDDFEWGEFEKYRKSFIEAGLPDPLWCIDCGLSMKLFKVEYEDSS